MADTTVCSSDSSPKSSEHKASIRKSNKPLMEKKRRARINSCLGQLKSLVLQALKKDTSQFSKLEKADILEMTVKHLKSVQQQHMSVAMASDPNVLTKYRAGFNECASEVMRYLGSVNGLSEDTRTRVLNHLAMCMQSVNTAASVSLATQAAAAANQVSLGSHMGSCGVPASLFPAFSSPQAPTQNVHLPTPSLSPSSGSNSLAVFNGPSHRVPSNLTEGKAQTSCPSSLQLIPGTLPTGQLAFFVASPATIQTPIQAIPVYTTPSSESSTPISSPEISPRGTVPEVTSPVVTSNAQMSENSEPSDNYLEKKNSTHQPTLTEQVPMHPDNHSIARCPRPPATGRLTPREPQSHPIHHDRGQDEAPPLGEHNGQDPDEEKVWRPW